MEKIYFSILIHAPREKVWLTMLSKETYDEWTKAFDPGSHYVGNWAQDSDIKFLGADSQTGMASKIRECRKPNFVSIEHVGIVMNGVVDTTSDEAKKWAHSFENYTFKEVDCGTELSVSLDVLPEYKSMFEEAWSKALKLLKELAEK